MDSVQFNYRPLKGIILLQDGSAKYEHNTIPPGHLLSILTAEKNDFRIRFKNIVAFMSLKKATAINGQDRITLTILAKKTKTTASEVIKMDIFHHKSYLKEFYPYDGKDFFKDQDIEKYKITERCMDLIDTINIACCITKCFLFDGSEKIIHNTKIDLHSFLFWTGDTTYYEQFGYKLYICKSQNWISHMLSSKPCCNRNVCKRHTIKYKKIAKRMLHMTLDKIQKSTNILDEHLLSNIIDHIGDTTYFEGDILEYEMYAFIHIVRTWIYMNEDCDTVVWFLNNLLQNMTRCLDYEIYKESIPEKLILEKSDEQDYDYYPLYGKLYIKRYKQCVDRIYIDFETKSSIGSID